MLVFLVGFIKLVPLNLLTTKQATTYQLLTDRPTDRPPTQRPSDLPTQVSPTQKAILFQRLDN